MELDTEATRSVIVAGLPVRARWVVGETPLDFDFSIARRGPRPLPKDDVAGGLEDVWSVLLPFGPFLAFSA